MFQTVQAAPPDAILGLSEAFKADPNPEKINLAVGVFKDETGKTPVLGSVLEAQRRLLDADKAYLPIDGLPAYGQHTRAMLFGPDSDLVAGGRAVTCQTPGGTGGLRVAGDLIAQINPNATIWLSDPTWANHGAIFEAAGLATNHYRYFDRATNGLDLQGMLASLDAVGAGDVVLLHGCCHNPTGVDPAADAWPGIVNRVVERGALPLVDLAYQGFGDGLESDAAGVRAVAALSSQAIVCSSYSKNFGLYNDRIGAVTFVAADADEAQAVLSQAKRRIRSNYSNPPANGARIVATILDDATLKTQWEEELAGMRGRINGVRLDLKNALDAAGVSLSEQGNDFITQQRGMFSFSGLSKDQVKRLKEQWAIYIVGSGRINVAGITPGNLPRLVEAIASVV